jgi:hypothetical protein
MLMIRPGLLRMYVPYASFDGHVVDVYLRALLCMWESVWVRVGVRVRIQSRGRFRRHDYASLIQTT